MAKEDCVEKILGRMSAGGSKRIFLLGCRERRVTIYSQQCRALNLVWALASAGLLKNDPKLCVVGAGLAGLTAAAACLHKGHSVDLLDSASELAALQAGCVTRFVHPHIYDWPAEGALSDNAGLPILNWRAGTADFVAKVITANWEKHYAANPRLTLLLNYAVDAVNEGAEGVTVAAQEGLYEELYDIVIIAVGFGIDRKFSETPSLSYWELDNLHKPVVAPPKPRRYIVSGTGDGGLVDFMRLTLRHFVHSELGKEFSGKEYHALREQLVLIDCAATELPTAKIPEFIHRKYKQLPIPDALNQLISDRIRTDTIVVLNGTAAKPYSLSTSLLNRFMTFLILRNTERFAGHARAGGRPAYWRGKLSAENVIKQGDEIEVTLGKNKHRFHQIVLRHGPEPALPKLLDAIVAAPDLEDITRSPAWDADFYPADAPGLTPEAHDTCLLLSSQMESNYQQSKRCRKIVEALSRVLDKMSSPLKVVHYLNLRYNDSLHNTVASYMRSAALVVVDLDLWDASLAYYLGIREAAGQPCFLLSSKFVDTIVFNSWDRIITDGTGDLGTKLEAFLSESWREELKPVQEGSRRQLFLQTVASALEAGGEFRDVTKMIANYNPGESVELQALKAFVAASLERLRGRRHVEQSLLSCLDLTETEHHANIELAWHYFANSDERCTVVARALANRPEPPYRIIGNLLFACTEVAKQQMKEAGQYLDKAKYEVDNGSEIPESVQYSAFLHGLVCLSIGRRDPDDLDAGQRWWNHARKPLRADDQTLLHPFVETSLRYDRFLIDFIINPELLDEAVLTEAIQSLFTKFKPQGARGLWALMSRYCCLLLTFPKPLDSICQLGSAWKVPPVRADLVTRLKRLKNALDFPRAVSGNSKTQTSSGS